MVEIIRVLCHQKLFQIMKNEGSSVNLSTMDSSWSDDHDGDEGDRRLTMAVLFCLFREPDTRNWNLCIPGNLYTIL